MNLSMDGVRRSNSGGTSGTATVMSLAFNAPKVRPVLKKSPLQNAVKRPADGVRYITGMDGIRRPVAMPTPRDVIANLAEMPQAPEAPTSVLSNSFLSRITGLAPRSISARPIIAFGLISGALIAATTTAYVVNNSRPIAANASTNHAKETQATKSTQSSVPAITLNSNQRQAALQQIIDQFTSTQPDGHYSILVKDLKSGISANVGSGESFNSASLYKLFVAQQIYQQLDAGQLTFDNGAGGGTGLNVGECMKLMVTISDNPCGRALGSILNWGAQDKFLAKAGYTGTSIGTPQVTNAHDVGLLYEKLYQGSLNSQLSNKAFLDLLKAQKVSNRLPLGLPDGTVIAHKTGDLEDLVHDAGIVYGPKTDYLVVVMSKGWNTPANAPVQFAALSQKLWNFFQR